MRVVPGTPSPLACCALRRRGGWATARGSSADAWPRSLPHHVARGIGRTIREQARQRGTGAAAVAAWKLGLLIIGQLVVFPLAVLPMALRSLEHRRANACILQIGPLPHQTVDVYESHNMKKVNTAGASTAGASTTGAAESSAAPLVLFVHGGSWAQVFVLSRTHFLHMSHPHSSYMSPSFVFLLEQGAPWQYALVARRLTAHLSSVSPPPPCAPPSPAPPSAPASVGVVRYRLFPEADIDQMLEDVELAIRWAQRQGGGQVILVGQSAGAQLNPSHSPPSLHT